MLYLSPGPIDHRERMRLHAIYEIEQLCRQNLWLIEQAKRRDEFTDGELASMRRDLHRIGHAHARNSIILESRGVKAPPREYLFEQGKSPARGCYVIRNGGRPQLLLYSGFGNDFGDITGMAVVKHLDDIGDDEDIDIRFNTPGGCVKVVRTICERLKERRGQTRGIVDGVAASGGSVILMHCNPIGIRRGAYIMCHFSRITGGLKLPLTANDLAAILDRTNDTDREIAESYLHRWRGSHDDLLAAMQEERDFVDQEAIDVGLADYIDPLATVATKIDVEAAHAKDPRGISNIRDRRAFLKFELEFSRWNRAAKSMPYDGESLLDSIKRRKRVDTEFAISAMDLVPRRLRDAAKACGMTV